MISSAWCARATRSARSSPAAPNGAFEVLQPTKGQHRQRGRHALAVTETAKTLDRRQVPARRLIHVTQGHLDSAEKIQRLGHTVCVAKFPEQFKRVHVKAGRLLRVFGGQMPVTDPVQRSRHQPTIRSGARRIECRMEVRARALVVARTPQPAEVELRSADQRWGRR